MDKLLTPKQLSALLQVSPALVYKWVHYDYIPYIKLGTHIRFKITKIEDWIQKRERKGRTSYRLKVIP